MNPSLSLDTLTHRPVSSMTEADKDDGLLIIIDEGRREAVNDESLPSHTHTQPPMHKYRSKDGGDIIRRFSFS